MAFIGVNFLIMFIQNILHYKKHKEKLNLVLIYIWIGFLFVNIGYYVFLLGNIGEISTRIVACGSTRTMRCTFC